MRNTQKEQIIAALLSNSDIPRCSRHFAFVLTADSYSVAKSAPLLDHLVGAQEE